MVYQAGANQAVLDITSARAHSALVVSQEFTAFHAAMDPFGSITLPTIFLHSRRTPAGRERLVAISADPVPSNRFVGFDARVFKPGTAIHGPVESTKQLEIDYPVADDVERIFAGQPDPHDLSHFTFTVVTHEKTLHFDGWLLDDDTVKLEPREGYPSPETFPASTEPATALPAR